MIEVSYVAAGEPKAGSMGFPWSCAARRSKKSQLARLWPPRARATELGRGRKIHRSVRAELLRALQPEARENTRGRPSRACKNCKNSALETDMMHIVGYG